MCVSVQFSREDGSGFGSWKTVLAVPVPRSVPGRTVPTVPVSSCGSVPWPPCYKQQSCIQKVRSFCKILACIQMCESWPGTFEIALRQEQNGCPPSQANSLEPTQMR